MEYLTEKEAIDLLILHAEKFANRRWSDAVKYRIIDTYNTVLSLNHMLPRKYKIQQHDAWGCVFASVVAIEAGFLQYNVIPMECSCIEQMNLFKKMNRFIERNSEPKRGDYVYYNWNYDSIPHHVGIVKNVSLNHITVIEGNNNGKIKIVKRPKLSHCILGYGRPDYTKIPKNRVW